MRHSNDVSTRPLEGNKRGASTSSIFEESHTQVSPSNCYRDKQTTADVSIINEHIILQ